MTSTVRRKRPPFAMVPEALLDADVSDRAIRLYALLDRYAGTTDKAWPSRATLASRLRCSDDRVDAAVHELERSGWIVVRRRQGPGASNLYVVRDTPQVATRRSSRRRAATRTDAASVAAPVRHEVEPRTRTPLPPEAAQRRAFEQKAAENEARRRQADAEYEAERAR